MKAMWILSFAGTRKLCSRQHSIYLYLRLLMFFVCAFVALLKNQQHPKGDGP